MSRTVWRIAPVAAAAIAIGSAAAVLQARDTHAPLPASEARLLYLHSGAVARRIFVSFDALAADVYWLRTIQHYGNDVMSSRATGRFELLEPLLNLTTSLDPHFNIAYRFGAIFLAEAPPKGPGRPDEAIALLEKGLANNPSRWQYAHDIGFVHYWYTGDYAAAARAFERAAAIPGAPEWIRPLAALTRAGGGDRAGARRLLAELLSADQPYIRQTAERALEQLQALDALDQLRDRVERYQAAAGAYPASWLDLVRARLLPGLPLDPTGTPYAYNPSSHAVSLSPRSGLLPLPALFAASRR